MPRKRLTDTQRAYVVKRLAAYDTLLSIVRGLKDEFGITIAFQSVAHYNAARPPDAKLAQRWKDLFWKTRKAFIAGTADTGFTDKPARIRQREAMMHAEWAAGRHKHANEILDSIAKDIGNAFRRTRRS
jgi:hypothetical protein